jgi:V/A-type H+-transporting ATPase subunit I
LAKIEQEKIDCTMQAVKLLPYRKQLKLLADNASFRMDMARADGDFAKTAQTFILEGFVPEPCTEQLTKLIDKTTKNVDLTLEDVKPEDQPPTLLKNNKVVTPYESITSVYSMPSYYEADPNPAVAIFYFIFFGIMLGDAGYGLILAIAAFVATKCFKMEKGTKNLLLVFGMGGVSAIIWGILFGGVFSIEAVSPVWFAPMSDPITMLVLCFALGLVQIFVGMGYQAYNLIKDGKAMDAVYDIFSWYAIFLGAGLAVLSVMVFPALPVWVGLAVLIAGVVVLMGGGAIRAKGVVGRIIGAVSPLYGIVNYFSDVMSYSRLFGLCLASGVIGLVFNTLGGLVWSLPVIGWLLAIVIFLLGHTLNFAIGLLGIYVHDSRLQYIEFFGRFYHGGGRAFAPLGLNLKYVTIKQEV